MPTTILTDLAEAKIALASGSGSQVAITHVALGDGNGASYVGDFAQTALRRERVRIPIESRSQIEPNAWRVKATFGPETVAFSVREAGFFDQDGDLIALCTFPASEVRQTGAISYMIEEVLAFTRISDGLVIVDAPDDDLVEFQAVALESFANHGRSIFEIMQLLSPTSLLQRVQSVAGQGLNALTLGGKFAADFASVTRKVTAGTGLSGGGSLGSDISLSAKIASQAEAETGTVTDSLMSPLRTKQALAAQVPGLIPIDFGVPLSLAYAAYFGPAVTAGDVIDGANLRPAGVAYTVAIADNTNGNGTASQISVGAGALPGNWRALGSVTHDPATSLTRITLFIRVP